MKKFVKGIICLSAVFISLSCRTVTIGSSNNTALAQSNVSFQVFYDQLSPYGAWIEYRDFGYVWLPRVEPGFIPYRNNGHWVYTEEGWNWFSGYQWGWAPFHYGRWFFDDMYGWMWVPGYEWAPAWVAWGNYEGYYGWAPLEPNIVAFEGYRPPIHYWSFVPRERICEPNLTGYVVRNNMIVHERIEIINERHNINRVEYFKGPRNEEVERYTHNHIAPYRVEEREHPLNNREIRRSHPIEKANSKPVPVYRPQIKKEENVRHAPAKVERIENLKPIKKTEEEERDKKEDREHHR